MESKDPRGDRLKAIEQVEAGRRLRHDQPLMARLDGKAFHTFTRGLKRPYDPVLSGLMADTTKYLIAKYHAKLGYTQSDEITLFWNNPDPTLESTYLFDAKIQKLTSVLAASAAAFFTRALALGVLPGKEQEIAVFDCRVWNVDDLYGVWENFLWRQDDAIKNSISMAAQAHFSSKKLHGVGSEEKKAMLRELGKPWEAEPDFFRWGAFFHRKTIEVTLTAEELAAIPEKHRPTGPVQRSVIVEAPIGYLGDLSTVEQIQAEYF